MGQLLTNINGPYCTGQTMWSKILMFLFKPLRYLPEVVAIRERREDEADGEFQRFVSVTKWHEMRRKGELLCPIRRGKRGSDREKLTGLPVDELKFLLVIGDPILMNVNLVRLACLDSRGWTRPSIPSILTVATPEARNAFLEMRGRPKTEGTIGRYGLNYPDELQAYGVVPIESQLVPDVKNLSEDIRQTVVRAQSCIWLENSLTPLEQAVLRKKTTRLPRLEILRRTIFRQHYTPDPEEWLAWAWARRQLNPRAAL